MGPNRVNTAHSIDITRGAGRWSRTPAAAIRAISIALVLAVVLGVTPPQQYAEAQVTPPAAGTIGGFVFADQNRNGIFDDSERRLGNVSITLTPAASPTSPKTTVTNAVGRYRFDALTPGTYLVAVVSPGGATPTTTTPQNVVLVAGAGRDDVNFGLALSDATTPTATPSMATPSPTSGGDLSIGGIVFGDTDRDGRRDAGENGIPGVQVSLRHADSGTIQSTATTGADGRYRFGNLAAGAYTVVTDRPSGTITTPSPVAVAIPPSQDNVDFGVNAAGPIATFTPTPLPGGNLSIGGIVFDDQDRDGRRDTGEDVIRSVQIVLRSTATGAILATATTGSDGRYRFGNLALGTYTVELPSRPVTTPVPLTVTIPPSRDDVNIGVDHDSGRAEISGIAFEDTNGNRELDSNEPRLNDLEIRLERVGGSGTQVRTTRTDKDGRYRFENVEVGSYTVEARPPSTLARPAIARVTVDAQTTVITLDFFLVRSASGTATAVARATNTVPEPGSSASVDATRAGRALASPTSIRTTPTPNTRRVAAQRLNGLIPRLTRFQMRSVTYLGQGRRVDAAADGAIIAPDRMVMRIVRNERVQEIVVVAQQGYVKSVETGNQWAPIPYAELRQEIELLAPLDALRAIQFVEAADEGGEVIVGGVPTTYYVGDVNTLALWEAVARGSDAAAQTIREMRIHAWVGQEDRIIRAERITANVLAPISDPSEIPDSVEFDAQFMFSEPDRPFIIVPPAIPTATPVPTLAPAVAAPAQAPSNGGPPGQGTPNATPGNGRNGLAATPGLGPDSLTLTPGPLPLEGLPSDIVEGLPPGEEPPTQREQVLAAERALVGLATGGQPRTGSVARGNQIVLDVPWRSQLDNTVYAPTNSGAASLASSLGAYGIDVAVPDLRALMNGLDSNYSPGATPRVETIARVAERGGLNVLDLYRGPRFNEWTVEQVRESLRRGYPVMTLVQGAVLPGGTPPGAARERWVTIVGQDGDELIYHDPAYPDEGSGAARRITARTLEQGWLAASTPRLGMALAQGPEAGGLLDVARGQPEPARPGGPGGSPSPSPGVTLTVPIVGTIAPTPPPTTDDNPWGLPVHPVLIVFWVLLLLLLLALLLRSLR